MVLPTFHWLELVLDHWIFGINQMCYTETVWNDCTFFELEDVETPIRGTAPLAALEATDSER